MSSIYNQALSDIAAVFSKIDDTAVERALTMIAAAKRIVVFGGGRERLQIMGFAMRLFHMGLAVAVEGDMTTPPVGRGDLFIVTVGPGEISTALALLGVAKEAGATILVLTAQPHGRVGARAGIFEIVRRLGEKGLVIVLISDEVPEVFFNADRVLHMAGGRIVHSFDPRASSLREIEEAVYA